MRRKLLAVKRDLWGGALIALCGALTIMEASSYAVGDLARMGPGYFPMLVGCALVALGILIPLSPDPDEALEPQQAASDDGTPHPTRAERLRGMACIAAGIGAFIVVGHVAGFLPATFALVFISALGDTSNTWRSAGLLAAAMTLFGAIVFSWALQLQFPMFRWG
ncbi:tripartite tricarboxylate transporter TctB family protein [Achromobacter pestifer]